MLCPHGNEEEYCPHCRVAKKQKPKQLVKLAPKDLPLDVKSKKELLKSKSIHEPKIFENTTLARSVPKPLSRSFDLAKKMFGKKSDLFKSRLEFIQSQKGDAEDIQSVKKEQDLFDLEGSFTK